jgi:hypothetical protein
MGITEYIPSKCTFSVLICAFDEDSARVARRIQRTCQQVCGLYTYNSTSGSPTPADSMFDIVARQYRTKIVVRPKLEAEPAVAILGRKAGPLRAAVAGAASTGTFHTRSPMAAYDPDMQILLSPRALDESEIYTLIADQVAAAIVAQL